MKNIYFIEAKSPGGHIFDRTPLPRLGSIILATILKNLGYNTKVFIEDIIPLNGKLMRDADLVCISSITPTAKRAFEIAKKYKNAGIPVAIGGPHSTFLPDESLRYADYVVRGEGEETLVELVKHLEVGKSLYSIKGLSFKDKEGKVVHNHPRELIKNLNEAPIPDFNLVSGWKKVNVAPIATSRGCPFACKFCSVIQMFGREYRYKTIDRVLDEIKAVAPEKNHVFFIDDNFAANKKRTKALLRAIIDSGIKIQWSAQVRTDVAKDPELLELMEKSGCFFLYIGLESINPETLKLYNKGQKLEDIENAIKEIKKHHIKIHGMFVLGADTDSVKNIRDTKKFARKLDIDTIQFLILTPLSGTPMFEEIKKDKRFLHQEWNFYDSHHVVFEPKNMTAPELHLETLKAMDKFYSWPRTAWLFLRSALEIKIVPTTVTFFKLTQYTLQPKIYLKYWKKWMLNIFFNAVIGVYAKGQAKKALSDAKAYLENIQERIIAEFDKKTNGLRVSILEIKKFNVEILCDSSYRNGSDKQKERKLEFLKMFLKKINIIPVIVEKESPMEELIIRIKTDNLTTGRTIFLKPISDFKLCEDISMLFNVKIKKRRKAYEKAKKEFGDIEFGSVQITTEP